MKASDNILNLPFIGIKFIFNVFSSISEKLKCLHKVINVLPSTFKICLSFLYKCFYPFYSIIITK